MLLAPFLTSKGQVLSVNINAVMIIGSSYLSNLHNQFLELLNKNNIEFLSIGETVPLKVSWVLNSVLVDKDSAGKLYFSLAK